MLSSLNQGERIAVAFLSVSLLVGGIVSVVEHLSPSTIGEFRIIRGALAAPDSLPADTTRRVVPSETNGKNVSGPKQEPWKLDPNRAPASELERLPRIGPKMAQRIVDFRREHGPFRRLEDLMKVKGVGPKIFQLLKPHIEITPPDTSR